MLILMGTTPDGRNVVGNVYKFYETYGVPLDIIFEYMHQQGAVPDWVDFYTQAHEAGMTHRGILGRLEEPVKEVFGVSFWEYLKELLDGYKNTVEMIRK